MTPATPLLVTVAALVLTGCSDLTGSEFTGRWATEGLELRASRHHSELRLPCATVSAMPPLRVDATGRFELSGLASHSYGSFVLILRGQFARDTLQADLTTVAEGAPAFTTHYVLVRGADPAFEQFFCLASAASGAA